MESRLGECTAKTEAETPRSGPQRRVIAHQQMGKPSRRTMCGRVKLKALSSQKLFDEVPF